MPKPGADGLYTIAMRGEQHTYEFRGSEQHTLETISNMISDLTGFKATYIRDKLLDRMAIGKKVTVKIASLWEGETPYLIVKRVS